QFFPALSGLSALRAIVARTSTRPDRPRHRTQRSRWQCRQSARRSSGSLVAENLAPEFAVGQVVQFERGVGTAILAPPLARNSTAARTAGKIGSRSPLILYNLTLLMKRDLR